MVLAGKNRLLQGGRKLHRHRLRTPCVQPPFLRARIPRCNHFVAARRQSTSIHRAGVDMPTVFYLCPIGLALMLHLSVRETTERRRRIILPGVAL